MLSHLRRAVKESRRPGKIFMAELSVATDQGDKPRLLHPNVSGRGSQRLPARHMSLKEFPRDMPEDLRSAIAELCAARLSIPDPCTLRHLSLLRFRSDFNGDGQIDISEVILACKLLKDQRRQSRRIACLFGIGSVLAVLVALASAGATAFLGVSWVEENKEMVVRDGVLAAKRSGDVVASARAIQRSDLAGLPALHSVLDYGRLDSLTLANVPPHNATVGFRIESYIWYNVSAMDLRLSLGYTVRIRTGAWRLEPPDDGTAGRVLHEEADGTGGYGGGRRLAAGGWLHGGADSAAADIRSTVNAGLTVGDTLGHNIGTMIDSGSEVRALPGHMRRACHLATAHSHAHARLCCALRGTDGAHLRKLLRPRLVRRGAD